MGRGDDGAGLFGEVVAAVDMLPSADSDFFEDHRALLCLHAGKTRNSASPCADR